MNEDLNKTRQGKDDTPTEKEKRQYHIDVIFVCRQLRIFIFFFNTKLVDGNGSRKLDRI